MKDSQGRPGSEPEPLDFGAHCSVWWPSLKGLDLSHIQVPYEKSSWGLRVMKLRVSLPMGTLLRIVPHQQRRTPVKRAAFLGRRKRDLEGARENTPFPCIPSSEAEVAFSQA